MKKKIIIIIILISCIVLGIELYHIKNMQFVETSTSNNVITNFSNNNLENTTTINNSSFSYIKEKGELNTSGLYKYNDSFAYEYDLMQNDMIYHYNCNLYHKIITNIDDYNKYKNRIEIPEMSESDFENLFLIIISNENLRKDDEKDLMIYDIYANETTTNIIMKQKENPRLDINQELLDNVFYAIVDKSQLRSTVEITIEK